MSRTTVKLGSRIFDKGALSRAANTIVIKTAKRAKDSTRRKMIAGPHTGVLYRRKRGFGYRRSHRASAWGQRPSPDTLRLVNSGKETKLSSRPRVLLDFDTKYAGILQSKLNRPIINDRDRQEFQKDMNETAEKEIRKLI